MLRMGGFGAESWKREELGATAKGPYTAEREQQRNERRQNRLRGRGHQPHTDNGAAEPTRGAICQAHTHTAKPAAKATPHTRGPKTPTTRKRSAINPHWALTRPTGAPSPERHDETRDGPNYDRHSDPGRPVNKTPKPPNPDPRPPKTSIAWLPSETSLSRNP